jgi:hypothetical protein
MTNIPVDPCWNLKDSATCSTLPTECMWYDSKNPPKPLFSEEFCHPAAATKDTSATEWDACIN